MTEEKIVEEVVAVEEIGSEEVTEEPVTELVVEPVEEVEESTFVAEVVEPEVDELSTFQAQLVKSLQLNDQLINELEAKEKELSTFHQIKESLEDTIDSKNEEITQLQKRIADYEAEKLRDRIDDVAHRWAKKVNAVGEQMEKIRVTLSSVKTEEELIRFEELIGIGSGNERSSPVPLTKDSGKIVETFGNGPDVTKMNPVEYKDYLFKQLARANKGSQ